MNVKDSAITESIGKLKKLYLTIMGNSLIKRHLYDSIVARDIWVNIEDLLGISKAAQTNEYNLEELYLQIISLVSFLNVLRNDVARHLKAVSESVMSRMEANQKILYRMTLGALDYNIDTLADRIGDLFLIITRTDVSLSGEEKAHYRKFPQLKDLGKSLIQ